MPGTYPVLTIWLIILVIAAAQQQLHEDDTTLRRRLREVVEDGAEAASSSNPFEDSLPLVEKDLKRRKKTDIFGINDKSVATLAPARVNQAVRAPPASSGEPAGLSASHLLARSLQDWEVEDFVLLATLDGAVYAHDRRTGAYKWTMTYENAPMMAPMVETFHYQQSEYNHSDEQNYFAENDYMFIVEPSKDGNLYIQHKDPNIGLQRLGISVKSLVERTPQFFDDPPLVYTAHRDTELYTVDADSGHVIKRFGTGGPVMNEELRCRRQGAFDTEEECKPRRTIQLGRVYYTIAVHSTLTDRALCTIKFSEWIPNNRDNDLQRQYVETKDKNHIYSLHDGRIIGIDYSQNTFGRTKFTRVLSSPVARVFDIVRPADADEGNDRLVLLTQPSAPPEALRDTKRIGHETDRNSRVFVNRTETGDWYAFSERTYPLVTSQAEWAKIFRSDAPGIEGQDPLEDDEDEKVDDPVTAYTGIHSIREIPDPSTLRTLPAPDPDSSVDIPVDRDIIAAYQHASRVPPSKLPATAFIVTFIILLPSSLALLLYYRNPEDMKKRVRDVLAIGRIDDKRAHEIPWTPSTRFPHTPPGDEASQHFDISSIHHSLNSLDTNRAPSGRGGEMTPPVSETDLPVGISNAPESGNAAAVQEQPVDALDPETKESTVTTVDIVVPSVVEAEDKAVEQVLERTASQATPEEDDSGDEDGDNGDSNDLARETTEDKSLENDTPMKKKTKRGKRGGKKHRKGKKPDLEPIMVDAPNAEKTPPASEGHVAVAAADSFRPALPDTPACNEIFLQKDIFQVGGITVYTDKENELGQGSNGTVVYRGTHQGRSVAVKRLMRSANSLANREIQLLLRSDAHENVIRYFGQETSNMFQYVILDLYTASLDQAVERPEYFPEMIPAGCIDTIDCLTQIMRGVEHLHSLKLVHRDLKPQNILVKARPDLRRNGPPQLKFVISDFGLCKQLDENNPNSTFAPTVAHTAAGTTGWRAPELLVDSRERIAAPPATNSEMQLQNVSVGSTGSIEGNTVDPTSGRRVTKAIDVFSLGCIFYYVMTHGKHPFDSGAESLGRDLRIKNDQKDLSYLRMFDYSFEGEDLVLQMLAHDPKNRISTFSILTHPYFWPIDKKLLFLVEFSDHFEHEKQANPDPDHPTPNLIALQSLADDVIGPRRDFLRALPQKFKDSLGKQRGYTGSRMLDLLRALRNKKNHFNDLDPEIKAQIEALPGGYWQFWAEKFPSLLICCHCLMVERDLVAVAPRVFEKYL